MGAVLDAGMKQFKHVVQAVLHQPLKFNQGSRKYTYNHENLVVCMRDPSKCQFTADHEFPPSTAYEIKPDTKAVANNVSNPAQKSVSFEKSMLMRHCPPGQTVLSLCCGSGTTVIAAAELGLSCIAIDNDPDQVMLARHRLQMWLVDADKKKAAAAAKPKTDASADDDQPAAGTQDGDVVPEGACQGCQKPCYKADPTCSKCRECVHLACCGSASSADGKIVCPKCG